MPRSRQRSHEVSKPGVSVVGVACHRNGRAQSNGVHRLAGERFPLLVCQLECDGVANHVLVGNIHAQQSVFEQLVRGLEFFIEIDRFRSRPKLQRRLLGFLRIQRSTNGLSPTFDLAFRTGRTATQQRDCRQQRTKSANHRPTVSFGLSSTGGNRLIMKMGKKRNRPFQKQSRPQTVITRGVGR